jgi:RNA-directed DNA polymerase
MCDLTVLSGFQPLRSAALRARRGVKPSRQTGAFFAELEQNLLALQEELRSGRYRPRPYRVFRITDPKPREIRAAHFRDRVVHHALCAVLEPRLEALYISGSYACRKGRGAQAAVQRCQQACLAFPWYARLDIRHFFEEVPHGPLAGRLVPLLEGAPVHALLATILSSGVESPGRGLPIGNLTSQHFANFYLHAADDFAVEALRVPCYLRYMDDIVAFGRSKREMWSAVSHLSGFIEASLGLPVKDEATRVAPVHAGLPFLGLRIWPGHVRLQGRRARRFRMELRSLEKAVQAGDVLEEHARQSICSRFAWASQSPPFVRSLAEGRMHHPPA